MVPEFFNKIFMGKPRLKKLRTILSLTLREFIQRKLKGDRRIVGSSFFHSGLDKPPTFWYPATLPDFKDYKTIGDIPMKILIKAGDTKRCKIQGYGRKTRSVFETILSDYDYSGLY